MLEVLGDISAQPSPPTMECTVCALDEHCFAQYLDADVLSRLQPSMTPRRVRRGSYVYRMGDPFDTLYFIQDGFFKSAVLDRRGQACIVGFPMAGDVLGLDGWADGQHNSEAMALQDSSVCELPLRRLLELSFDVPALQQSLHRMMGREIARTQQAMHALSSLPAEEKLLVFLRGLSRRFAARGIAADDFNLPMTREEIAGYLGVQMETVSRAFTKLHVDGLINVHRRRVRIEAARAA
jgi:CRP/FNR family transcriptional regulator